MDENAIVAPYQHLIGQPYGDGSQGVVIDVEVWGPRLVKAVLEDGTRIDCTPFAKGPK